MKLLTIAVPAYNVEKTLAATLESFCIEDLLEQLDVIVVDDGSGDRTAEIARGFAARFPDSFRLVSKANGGHGSAVNTGIRLARGRYFKVVDGDDRLERPGLRALVSRLAVTEADLVATHYKKVPEGARPDSALAVPMRFEQVPFGRAVPFGQLPLDGTVYFGIHSLTYRTALLRQHDIALQERTFYVDAEYGVLPIPFVRTVEFLDVYTYLYTVGASQQSTDTHNFVRRYDDHLRVVQRLVGYLSACETDRPHAEYIRTVLRKLCFTQYMLAAFYDDDTARGRGRARAFDTWLLSADPCLYRLLGQSGYIALLRRTHFVFLPRGQGLKRLVKRVHTFFKRFVRRRKFTY